MRLPVKLFASRTDKTGGEKKKLRLLPSLRKRRVTGSAAGTACEANGGVGEINCYNTKNGSDNESLRDPVSLTETESFSTLESSPSLSGGSSSSSSHHNRDVCSYSEAFAVASDDNNCNAIQLDRQCSYESSIGTGGDSFSCGGSIYNDDIEFDDETDDGGSGNGSGDNEDGEYVSPSLRTFVREADRKLEFDLAELLSPPVFAVNDHLDQDNESSGSSNTTPRRKDGDRRGDGGLPGSLHSKESPLQRETSIAAATPLPPGGEEDPRQDGNADVPETTTWGNEPVAEQQEDAGAETKSGEDGAEEFPERMFGVKATSLTKDEDDRRCEESAEDCSIGDDGSVWSIPSYSSGLSGVTVDEEDAESTAGSKSGSEMTAGKSGAEEFHETAATSIVGEIPFTLNLDRRQRDNDDSNEDGSVSSLFTSDSSDLSDTMSCVVPEEVEDEETKAANTSGAEQQDGAAGAGKSAREDAAEDLLEPSSSSMESATFIVDEKHRQDDDCDDDFTEDESSVSSDFVDAVSCVTATTLASIPEECPRQDGVEEDFAEMASITRVTVPIPDEGDGGSDNPADEACSSVSSCSSYSSASSGGSDREQAGECGDSDSRGREQAGQRREVAAAPPIAAASVASQEAAATATVNTSRVEDLTKIFMRTKNVFKIRATSNCKSENNDSCSKATGILRSCSRLLSTEDVDRNRMGLQRLAIAVARERQRIAPVSRALVYGGPSGSDEEVLQCAFAAIICDSPYDDTCDTDHRSRDEHPTTMDHAFDHGGDDDDEEEEKKEALFDWILEYDPSKNSSTEGNIGSCSGDIDASDDDRDEESDSDRSRSSSFLGGSESARDDNESIEDVITALAEFERRRARRSVYDNNNSGSGDLSGASLSTNIPQPSRPQGTTDGILRNQALRILATALNKFVAPSSSPQRNEAADFPFLHDAVWRGIVRNLIDGIENDSDGRSGAIIASTGYSLSILRSLHAMRPDLVAPLMRYTMFERISHYATEHHFCGDKAIHPFPMIRMEASHLLRAVF